MARGSRTDDERIDARLPAFTAFFELMNSTACLGCYLRSLMTSRMGSTK
jgi:hypothetical protein